MFCGQGRSDASRSRIRIWRERWIIAIQFWKQTGRCGNCWTKYSAEKSASVHPIIHKLFTRLRLISHLYRTHNDALRPPKLHRRNFQNEKEYGAFVSVFRAYASCHALRGRFSVRASYHHCKQYARCSSTCSESVPALRSGLCRTPASGAVQSERRAVRAVLLSNHNRRRGQNAVLLHDPERLRESDATREARRPPDHHGDQQYYEPTSDDDD